jgi:hypothetical protein
VSYTMIKVYDFECDAPECSQSEEFVPMQGQGLRGAIRDAKREGWQVSSSGPDLCPRHASGSTSRRYAS